MVGVLGFESPCFPYFRVWSFLVGFSGEELDFGEVREHVLDAFSDFLWFLGVFFSVFAYELSDISGSSWFWYFPSFEEEAEFALTEGIESGVRAHFVPDESDGCPFEPPCFSEFDGLVEVWAGAPEEEEAVWCGDVADLQLPEFLEGEGWVVLEGSSGILFSRPCMLELSLVVPWGVCIYDLEFFVWEFSEEFFCIWLHFFRSVG